MAYRMVAWTDQCWVVMKADSWDDALAYEMVASKAAKMADWTEHRMVVILVVMSADDLDVSRAAQSVAETASSLAAKTVQS